MHYIPSWERDGVDEKHFYSASVVEGSVGKLGDEAADYLRGLNRLCGMDANARGELDKTNVHHLIELYRRSIPLFGSA